MGHPIGTTTIEHPSLENVTATPAAAIWVPLNACRTQGSLQVILGGGVNFTGGTVNVYPSLDGTNTAADTTAIATFTIGTDASGVMKFWSGKPCTWLKVVVAGLTGGTNPTMTALLAAY